MPLFSAIRATLRYSITVIVVVSIVIRARTLIQIYLNSVRVLA
jgi:hypothetical protein